MPKVDWRRARKFTRSEDRYDAGTVLERGPDAGRVIYGGPRDSLDARAKAAERKWLKQLGKQGEKL